MRSSDFSEADLAIWWPIQKRGGFEAVTAVLQKYLELWLEFVLSR